MGRYSTGGARDPSLVLPEAYLPSSTGAAVRKGCACVCTLYACMNFTAPTHQANTQREKKTVKRERERCEHIDDPVDGAGSGEHAKGKKRKEIQRAAMKLIFLFPPPSHSLSLSDTPTGSRMRGGKHTSAAQRSLRGLQAARRRVRSSNADREKTEAVREGGKRHPPPRTNKQNKR